MCDIYHFEQSLKTEIEQLRKENRTINKLLQNTVPATQEALDSLILDKSSMKSYEIRMMENKYNQSKVMI